MPPAAAAVVQHAPHRPAKKTSTTFHLIAGLSSGFTSAILLQPIDLLKTRLQQSGSRSLSLTFRSILAGPQPIRELWRGTIPSVIRTSVGSALYFSALNALRSNLAKTSASQLTGRNGETKESLRRSSALPQITALANLSSGAIARASVGFLMMPITVIKVRYESSTYQYGSLARASKAIYQREGLRGFFAGFGATAIRDAPYAGLYVVFYESGKAMIGGFAEKLSRSLAVQSSALAPGREMTTAMSASVNFLASMVAASAATFATNPPDAIKTRLQLYPHKYKNTVQTLRLMLREEGVRSLFDGLSLRMARKALSSALAWTVYEEIVRRAEKKFVED